MQGACACGAANAPPGTLELSRTWLIEMKKLKFKNLELKNPLLMSPLCGVTDVPFRTIARELGSSLTHTQMVSSAALARSSSPKKTMRIMDLAEGEDPVGIQLFGCDPAEMGEGARKADERGAHVISIN